MRVIPWKANTDGARTGSGAARRKARRGLCLLLCCALLSGVFPAPAAEATETAEAPTVQTYTEPEQYYALQVSTGAASGENIRYFTVRYLDDTGVQRGEMIYPGFEGLRRSYEIAKQAGGDLVSEKQKQMKDYVSALAEEIRTDEVQGLQPYSTDTYLFKPHFTLKKLVGIDILLRYDETGETKNAGWTCGGLQVYRVDRLGGMDMQSYYGKNILVRFSGELIGEMYSAETLTYACPAKGSKLYRIREKNPDSGEGMAQGCELKVYGDGTRVYDTDTNMLLAVSFADIYGGGLGTHCKDATVKEYLTECESLTMRVSYRDLRGWTMNVDVPLLSGMLCWLLDSGCGDRRICDMAQQGETVYCPIYLPGMDKSIAPTLKLFYGAQKASELCGLKYDAKNATKQTTVNISGVRIYGQKGTVTVGDGNNLIGVSGQGEPLWYYTSPLVQGDSVSTNGEFTVRLERYQSGARLAPVDSNSYYLVELTTDNVKNAGTADDLTLNFRYLDNLDEERGAEVDVRTQLESYYGHCEPSAYETKLSPGETARLLLQLSDVKKFTGVEISLAEDSGDVYQLAGIRVYPVTYRGSRTFRYDGKWVVDRDIEYRAEDIAVDFSGARVLVAKGEKKVISFGKTSAAVTRENLADWSNYRVTMSYSDALKEMGYTNVRAEYQVEVQVGSDSGEITGNGDTGSENMFYFQLVFDDNRTSAYVLANQLIAAGRFRGGQKETFTVYMNYDYGDVKAVRIIPDDTIKEGESFDKLYLEDVTIVRKDSGIGISKTWTASVGEWIDIDYIDTGVRNTVSGQSGRKEGKLARTYSVTMTSYVTDFIVELPTQGYASDGEMFSGVLFAEVNYTNRSGAAKRQSFDVFDAMRSYMSLENQGTMSCSQITGKLSGRLMGGQRINRSEMLLPGMTNRFKISVGGAAAINSITFYAASDGTAGFSWSFNQVKIYRITGGEGLLYLDENGFYDRDYTTVLLDASKIESFVMQVPADGSCQERTVTFNGEEIPINEAEATWTTLIGREPDSVNDELNVYVYMYDAVGAAGDSTTPIGDYEMNLTVSYCYDDAYGGHYTNGKNGVSRMARDYGKNAFYTRGLAANGLSSLNGLILQARDKTNPNRMADFSVGAYVQRVVVERVRSGVAISSYSFSYDGLRGSTVGSGLTVRPTLNTSESPEAAGRQVVYLQFGAGTEEFTPMQGTGSRSVTDIAVALEYHSVNMTDPDGSVRTKNLFLSEVCSGRTLRENDVVKLEFNAEYLDGIVGVQLVAMGGVTATVSGVSVGVEEEREVKFGDTVRTEKTTVWYGSTNTGVVSVDRTAGILPVLKQDSGGRVPVTLSIRTGTAAAGESVGGCADPIRADIVYQDPAGGRRVFSISDLNDYTESGGFGGGETAVIRLLLPQLASIHYIELEPLYAEQLHVVRPSVLAGGDTEAQSEEALANVGTTETASWRLDGIVSEIGEAGVSRSRVERSFGQAVYEGSPFRANLSGITISACVTANGGADYTYAVGEDVTVLAASGAPVKLSRMSGKSSLISGSFGDVSAAAVRVLDGASASCSELLTSSVARNSAGDSCLSELVFNTPRNTGTGAQSYRVTLTSEEIPTLSVSVNITVSPEQTEGGGDAAADG